MKPLRLYSVSTSPAVLDLSKSLNVTPQVISSLQEEEADSAAHFSSHLYLSQRQHHPSTQTSGRVLLHAEELSSTQTLVLETPSCNESVVCVADFQSNGRGRGSNTWESPLGCLLFSFRSSLPAQDGRLLPFFQYLVSLALVRTCRKTTGNMNIHIKWPNDVYANRTQKIGGVLCQSSLAANSGDQESKFVITTGVGLNVENEVPTTCLSFLAKHRVRREIVLAEFFFEFDSLYSEFLSERSFEPFVREYQSLWLHDGQRVGVDAGAKQVTITGISATTGSLLAVDDMGALMELSPDGNRLDFFKGLVSRRMQ